MDFITAPLVVGIIFYTIYRIFDLLVRRKERQMFIDKIDPNKLGDSLKMLDFSNAPAMTSFSSAALKWGCLMIGVGLGLLCGFLLNISFGPEMRSSYNEYNASSVAYGSCVMFFGGIGLIVAFLIERHYDQKPHQK